MRTNTDWNVSLTPVLLFLMAALACAATFSSCASMDAYEAQFCSYDRAYTKGYDDGSKGSDSRIDEFARCSVNADQAMKGYREGFEKGTTQLYGSGNGSGNSKVPGDSKPTTSGPTINIGIGGRDVSIGNGESNSGTFAKAYYCELEAFTQKFESFGPTMLEAKKAVRDQCSQRYHRMHCDGDRDLHCRKNI